MESNSRVHSRFLCTEVRNALPYLYSLSYLSDKPVLDSYTLSYKSQAMYHLTTASEHEQLAFASLESETGRYASQLAYSKDIYARVSSPDSDISGLFCVMLGI